MVARLLRSPFSRPVAKLLKRCVHAWRVDSGSAVLGGPPDTRLKLAARVD
jgi:hypothetical protein